jgi:hypothetical protein
MSAAASVETPSFVSADSRNQSDHNSRAHAVLYPAKWIPASPVDRFTVPPATKKVCGVQRVGDSCDGKKRDH